MISRDCSFDSKIWIKSYGTRLFDYHYLTEMIKYFGETVTENPKNL